MNKHLILAVTLLISAPLLSEKAVEGAPTVTQQVNDQESVAPQTKDAVSTQAVKSEVTAADKEAALKALEDKIRTLNPNEQPTPEQMNEINELIKKAYSPEEIAAMEKAFAQIEAELAKTNN